MDDHELLREYVENRSETAFRQLVDRHVGMVYSAAFRMVRDAALAEEVAQNVFATLAQKARSVRAPQVVGGWLYNTTRYLAMHAVRAEQRRREREHTAAIMQSLHTNSDAERIIDQLEPAMEKLADDERDVLVLRFLENRNLRDVGAELGISEDAARMRVNRALEQLRAVLDREGIGITSVLLASTLAAGTSSAVPTGLSAAIAAAAVAGSMATVGTQTLLITMNWINAKSAAAIVGALIVGGTASYFVQQRQIDRLRADYQELAAQRAREQTERDTASAPAAVPVSNEELDRLRQDASDLLRLRSEVTQLRLQLEEARLRAGPAPAPKPVAATPTTPRARYFSKQNLAFAGYSTPEAALQSITWSTMAGMALPNQIEEGLSPNMLTNTASRENFERNRQMTVAMFKGVEVLAKKTVSHDKVEFKLRLDMNTGSGSYASTTMTIPMLKVGDQWKLDDEIEEYNKNWDENGQIETYLTGSQVGGR